MEKKEKKIISVLLIQCRFRIFSAKKRIKLIIQNHLLCDIAALTIQRNWYKFKNEFSGFLLLSAYRARQIIDFHKHKQLKKDRKNRNIIKIQQLFRKYVKRKFLFVIIFIQKYFRRFRCTNYLINMRKIKIAGRKIKFWMKGMMKKRNKLARILQRMWWSKVSGRLYRHLHGTFRRRKEWRIKEKRGEERRREEKRRVEKRRQERIWEEKRWEEKKSEEWRREEWRREDKSDEEKREESVGTRTNWCGNQ